MNIVKIAGKKTGIFYEGTLAYFQSDNRLFRCTVLSISSSGMCRIRLGEAAPGFCKSEMLSAPQSLVIPRAYVKKFQGNLVVNSSYVWEQSRGGF